MVERRRQQDGKLEEILESVGRLEGGLDALKNAVEGTWETIRKLPCLDHGEKIGYLMGSRPKEGLRDEPTELEILEVGNKARRAIKWAVMIISAVATGWVVMKEFFKKIFV